MVVVALIIGLSATIPFGILCIAISKFLHHKTDMDDRKLKLAVLDNSHSAWEEFDVKYKKQFEYEMESQ